MPATWSPDAVNIHTGRFARNSSYPTAIGSGADPASDWNSTEATPRPSAMRCVAKIRVGAVVARPISKAEAWRWSRLAWPR